MTNSNIKGTASTVHTVDQLNVSRPNGSRPTPYHASATHGGVIHKNEQQRLFQDSNARSTGMKLSASDNISYQGMQVLNEQVIEHEIKVPTLRRRESIRERTIVIPEKIITEELVEETKTVRERVIQVAKPVYREKVVEVPEIEIIENIVEVPEVNIEWIEKQIDKPIFQEVVREVKRVVEVEKVVNVDQITTVEVPVVKQVEVPEYKMIVKEVPRPIDRYVTVEVPEYKDVEVFREVHRKVPVPMEHIIHQNYELPQLEAEYDEVHFPVFIPSFVQVPIPADQMTDAAVLKADAMARKVAMVSATEVASLCVIEELGDEARKHIVEMITNPDELRAKASRKLAEFNNKPSKI